MTRPHPDSRAARRAECDVDCDANCADPCALAALPLGVRAIVVLFACPHAETSRLRVLGLFEGACIRVVGRSSGLLLEVCGTRIAIGTSLAMAIIARPTV